MCSCVGWQMNRLMKMTKEEAEIMKITADEARKTAVLPEADQLIKTLFDDLDFEVAMTGRKSSEGDGRTAADIEREMVLAAREN
jgi:hypothetical protein